MRRVQVYILLVLILGETTSLCQLVKVPVLYTHFIEHNRLDPTVDFYTFLEWHYWGEDANDQDDDRDMQLPFKKFDHQPLTLLYCFANKVTTQQHYWPIKVGFNTDQSQAYADLAPISPFRPPRS